MNQELEANTNLSHYRIVSKIGAGGMGEVYLAEDTKLDRRVALKILPAEFAEDKDRMNRFVREAKSASALNHPNIITIHEIGESEGTHFIATEFIDGKTLNQYAKDNALNLKSAFEIAIQIASALDEAHIAGIVHRDIKPDNVMVRSNGLVKILDFGIAKLAEASPANVSSEDATVIKPQSTMPGMIIGTPNYMSPEQARGQTVDRQTDIFSFGVVLYEMLSGSAPFAGDTVSDILVAVLTKEAKPLANVPPELAAIVQKSLQKDRQKRYQTAKDLLEDLKEVKQELEIQSRLEKTASPNLEEPQTQILQAPTTAEKSPTSNTKSEDGFWVAVLPFKYRGANADLEALAEGLSEEVVTGLSRFSYLRVIARGSTLGYASDAGDVRTIGKELGARYVMEGSLRQVGATMRLAVHLIDTSNGVQLWSENYQRAFSSEALFDLQDELVPRIVSTVADWYGVLPHFMSEFVRLKSPEKLSPYEALLRSFGYTERLTAEDHLETRDILERAVGKSPENADCWAMLSTIYADEYKFGYNLKPDPLSRTLAAALRAVEAAPSNSFANYALAQARFFRKEFDAFRSAAERAIALNPMNGAVAAYMGQLLFYAGDSERGCELSEKARQLNPQHPGWYWAVPFHQAYTERDYRRALDYVLKMNMPGFFVYHMHLTATYGQLGEHQLAAQSARDLLAVAPDIELIVRDFCEKWVNSEDAEHLLEGLQKAGLKIAVAPNQEEPKTQILKAQTTSETETGNSIAVLPFTNMSADEDNEYFCDGLAEELLNALSKIEDLKVAARTSAFSFKGKNANISEIGEKLSVKNVLEGSVRRSGNKLRISVQLINAADGYQLWSERYDREMQDIFDVQDEIALVVVDALKLKLFGDEKAAILKRGTENQRAYELYLKGRFFFNKFTRAGIEKAVEFYEQAIAIDANYALAFVGISDAYFYLSIPDSPTGYLSPKEALPKVTAAAERAIEIDEQLAEAWASLAHIKEKSCDLQGAKEAYRRSFELNANHPLPHSSYGAFLSALGEHEQALQEVQLAHELDPFSVLMNVMPLVCLNYARRYDEAIAHWEKIWELELAFPTAGTFGGLPYLQTKRYAEAIEIFRQAVENSNRSNTALAYLGHAFAVSGNKLEAERLLHELLDLSKVRYVSSYSIALIYVGLDEKDKAIESLVAAYEETNMEIVFLNVEPRFDPLRADPRFQDIIRRIGFPIDKTNQTDESLEAKTVMLSTGEAASEPPAKDLETENAETKPTIEPATNAKSEIQKPKSKWWLFGLLSLIVFVGGFFGYKYFTPNKQIESIAVMPFENKSSDADTEYLSDGLAESLIYRLSQLPNLKVSPTSSVFRYKGKATDPQRVAKELGVDSVMTGRITQRGDNLTISVNLVDTRNGKSLWGDQYERKMSELLTTQREIATEITNKLQLKLSGASEKVLTKQYTTNPEAYQLYLKGNFYASQYTKESLAKGVEYYNQAIAIDPNYALAYNGLAYYYIVAVDFYLSPSDSMPKAREAAQRALAIDDKLADAHTSLAVVLHWYDWDWAAAEKEYQRAIELNPKDSRTLQDYSWFLAQVGRSEQAVAVGKKAQTIWGELTSRKAILAKL